MRHIAHRTNNIVQWTEYDRGGHFAALEQPELLVGDIRTFFRRLRPDPSAPDIGDPASMSSPATSKPIATEVADGP
jgi:hypothetical protein